MDKINPNNSKSQASKLLTLPYGNEALGPYSFYCFLGHPLEQNSLLAINSIKTIVYNLGH